MVIICIDQFGKMIQLVVLKESNAWTMANKFEYSGQSEQLTQVYY